MSATSRGHDSGVRVRQKFRPERGKDPTAADTNLVVGVRQELAGAVDTLSLLDWRCRYLEMVGLEARLALSVCLDPTIDLHVMVEMVDQGWPGELVVSLLAGGLGGGDGGRG